MRTVLVIVCVAVSGCSGMGQHSVVSSSERTVVIEAFFDEIGEAQKLADAECSKHRRVARLSGPAKNYKLIYDCVI